MAFIQSAIEATQKCAGLVDYERKLCGCQRWIFSTGTIRNQLCWKHDTTSSGLPRHCPCGLMDELTMRTATAHRLGDDEAVDYWRRQRQQHMRECGEQAA